MRDTQKEVRESERWHRIILNSVNDIIFTVDLRGNYTYINLSARRITGYSASEALQMNMSELIAHEKDLKMLQNAMQNAIRGTDKKEPHFEYQIRTKSGELRWLELTTTPQRKKRRVVGFFGVARDITERKKAEEEVKRTKEAAEAANRAKSEFLANMGHDLRTPLNAILGYAQILGGESDLPDRHRNAVENIGESGQHLLQLINDILDISKIEAGREEFNASDFDLRSLIHSVESMFDIRCQEKQLNWKLDLDVPHGSVCGDVKWTP